MIFRHDLAKLLVWSLLAAGVNEALAQQEGPAVSDEIPENLVRNEDADSSTGLGHSFRQVRQRMRDSASLDANLSYHSLAMASFGGDDVQSAVGGDLTLQGLWKPGVRWQDSNATEIHFRLRHRHAIGATAPSALGDELGTLWGLVDGFSDGGFEIPDLYLQQGFDRAGITVRFGQMTVDSQFDRHALRSSKSAFLNRAFSSNPAIAFPRSGAGISLVKDFGNGFEIAAAATNVQGRTDGKQVDFHLDSDNLFKVVQMSREFELWERRVSRLQLLGWHSDGAESTGSSEGSGVSLTAEQEVSDQMRVFARVSWAEGEATPVDRIVMGGLGVTCGREGLLGIAAGVGHGSGSEGGTQAVVEGFYRWRPYPDLFVSTEVQVVGGNGLKSSPGIRVVPALRVALEF